MTDKVLYQELLPHELIERVNDCPIAYLPLGTLEWHGFHLPYGVDMLLPLEAFKRMASRVGGVVLPPLFLGPDNEMEHDGKKYFGMDVWSFEEGHPQQLIGSAYHIPEAFYIQLLEHILQNLKHNGFAAVIGHGHGPSSEIFYKQKERFEKEYGLFITNLYESGKDFLVDHAAVNETSLMMSLVPGFANLSRMPEGASPAVWGSDPRGAASAEEGARIAAENEEAIIDLLLKLKETLPKPGLTLEFHHVKDLTKE
ncbi:MAG: creatininase family protein [Oscillospiraceae bacterium]|nr:creatininase family protein [Oscillospiraceae bacterium]